MDTFVAIEDLWTRERVEGRLIAAAKVLPGAAVFRPGLLLQQDLGRLQTIITETLNWSTLLRDDPTGRIFLGLGALPRERGQLFGILPRGGLEAANGRRWSPSGRADAGATPLDNP